MQETRVRSLVGEDPTCHGATKPVRLEPTLQNKSSHCSEDRITHTRVSHQQLLAALEKVHTQRRRPNATKNINKKETRAACASQDGASPRAGRARRGSCGFLGYHHHGPGGRRPLPSSVSGTEAPQTAKNSHTDRTHVPLPDPAQPDTVHRMFFNWEHTDGALQLGQVYGAPTTNPMPVIDIQSPVWSAPPSMRRQAEGGQPSATRGRACSHPGKIANVQSAHSTKDILHLPSWSPPIRAVRRPLHRWGN